MCDLEARHAIPISENLSVVRVRSFVGTHPFDQSFQDKESFFASIIHVFYIAFLIMSIKVFYITRERH